MCKIWEKSVSNHKYIFKIFLKCMYGGTGKCRQWILCELLCVCQGRARWRVLQLCATSQCFWNIMCHIYYGENNNLKILNLDGIKIQFEKQNLQFIACIKVSILAIWIFCFGVVPVKFFLLSLIEFSVFYLWVILLLYLNVFFFLMNASS